MKKQLIVLSIALFAFLGAQAQQGQLKIGYTNVDYIIGLMPASKTVDANLKKFKKELEDEIISKYEKLQTLIDEFQRKEHLLAEPVKESKKREIANLKDDIDKLQMESEYAYQQKQAELLKPILEDVQNAIDDVAKTHGYTYIFNSDAGIGTMPILLYGPEQDNVSDLVLKELGVTPPGK